MNTGIPRQAHHERTGHDAAQKDEQERKDRSSLGRSGEGDRRHSDRLFIVVTRQCNEHHVAVGTCGVIVGDIVLCNDGRGIGVARERHA